MVKNTQIYSSQYATLDKTLFQARDTFPGITKFYCAEENSFLPGTGVFHGHLIRTAHKLSATKIEPSYRSTGHSTHL